MTDYPIGRQPQPLQGNWDKDEKCEANSNYYQLIKLRCDEDPSITTWLQKKSNKYTSVDIQNEILEVLFFFIECNQLHMHVQVKVKQPSKF